MQKIGTMIDTSQLGCRDIHYETAIAQISYNRAKYICWGADRFGVDKLIKKWGTCKWFRFWVSGLKHTGWVYVELNGADLYDIYYVSQRHRIKLIDSDIYGTDICDRIDETIEKQANYTF